MTISFNQIPTQWRVPLFYAEFDNSAAVTGGAIQEYKLLFVGQKVAAGTKGTLGLDIISSVEQAYEFYGPGSILADMLSFYLKNNKVNSVYAMALPDAGAGIQATGKVAFTGTPTASGVASFLIAGRSYKIAVSTSSTGASLATALAAAITADSFSLVSAVVNGTSTNEVDLTAKNKGEFGNEIDVRHSHFMGEALPAGLTVTVTAMSGGAANPDVDGIWPVVGDEQFILVQTPYKDSSSLDKMETEFTQRYGPIDANEGFGLYGVKGSLGAVQAITTARNSVFTTFLDSAGPNAPWQWVSAALGQIALAASNDPARPFQTLQLLGITAPKITERRTKSENNTLLFNGCSTYQVNAGGQVELQVVITTYRVNSFGSPDVSYLYLNTPLTLSYLRFDLAARITSRFPRHKLADDGTQFDPGQAIVTPKVIKAEVVSKFREWERKGLVENFDQFVADLIVERDTDNRNRVNILMPPDLVNQLMMVATRIQFRI